MSHFWSRPFKIIGGEQIAKAIIKNVKEPRVKRLTRRSLIGSIDLISDNTDLLMDDSFRSALKALYE